MVMWTERQTLLSGARLQSDRPVESGRPGNDGIWTVRERNRTSPIARNSVQWIRPRRPAGQPIPGFAHQDWVHAFKLLK